jgi:hypothetical protein
MRPRVKERVGDRIWQAFWLKTVEGRRGAEIAQRLGMTVGAVYQAGSRARSLLEREFGVCPRGGPRRVNRGGAVAGLGRGGADGRMPVAGGPEALWAAFVLAGDPD